jgi:hypothetical protein
MLRDWHLPRDSLACTDSLVALTPPTVVPYPWDLYRNKIYCACHTQSLNHATHTQRHTHTETHTHRDTHTHTTQVTHDLFHTHTHTLSLTIITTHLNSSGPTYYSTGALSHSFPPFRYSLTLTLTLTLTYCTHTNASTTHKSQPTKTHQTEIKRVNLTQSQ